MERFYGRDIAEKCFNYVIGICFKYYKSFNPEELAQNVFLRLIKSSRGFCRDDVIKKYVSRVCRNTAFNMLRDRKYKFRKERLKPNDFFDSIGSLNGVDEMISQEYVDKTMMPVIRALPRSQREVVLELISGAKPVEIAKERGVSRHTVNALIFSARRKLSRSFSF